MLSSRHVGSGEIRADSEAPLEMVAKGLPIYRTLSALAVLASRIQRDARSAILLLEDDRLLIAAQNNLEAQYQNLLRQCTTLSGTHAWNEFASLHSIKLRPLLTPAAELIGWVALLGVDSLEVSLDEQELEQVCWIATLAIEQKHLLDEIAYQGHHDALTHLWNRVWMEKEIERVLASPANCQGFVGLAQIGIDSLRVINDVLGHHVGNELLRQVAERLSRSLPPSFALARGSGDEFIVLMPCMDPDEQAGVCHDLLESFEEAFQIGDHELIVRATVGSTAIAHHRCTAAELQSQSNIALHHAKKRARGRAAVFEPSMVMVPPERLVMEQHLRFASQKREFQLHYQPQIEIASGNLIGVEALLRWHHPALGFISPGTFIPIAEEIGIIEEIGEWALDQAVRFLDDWRAAGLGSLRMAVNVSGIQFSRGDFASVVAKRLRNSRIAPEDLELEITESALMTNLEHGLRQLKLLRSLGASLAIDDFGTGHSSLAYLQQLPVQRLKIDRMFVQEIGNAEDRPPLISSIIQMAHALGLSVIAEGVEWPEQALALAAMKCEEIQGFLVSRPLPGDAFLSWARERSSLGNSRLLRNELGSLVRP